LAVKKPSKVERPLLHCATCLALCIELHGTDKAVTDLCKKLVKLLPRTDRRYIFDIMNAKSPLKYAKDFLDMLNKSGIIERLQQTPTQPASLETAESSSALSRC